MNQPAIDLTLGIYKISFVPVPILILGIVLVQSTGVVLPFFELASGNFVKHDLKEMLKCIGVEICTSNRYQHTEDG
jgi:hypothetical protein